MDIENIRLERNRIRDEILSRFLSSPDPLNFLRSLSVEEFVKAGQSLQDISRCKEFGMDSLKRDEYSNYFYIQHKERFPEAYEEVEGEYYLKDLEESNFNWEDSEGEEINPDLALKDEVVSYDFLRQKLTELSLKIDGLSLKIDGLSNKYDNVLERLDNLNDVPEKLNHLTSINEDVSNQINKDVSNQINKDISNQINELKSEVKSLYKISEKIAKVSEFL